MSESNHCNHPFGSTCSGVEAFLWRLTCRFSLFPINSNAILSQGFWCWGICFQSFRRAFFRQPDDSTAGLVETRPKSPKAEELWGGRKACGNLT